MISNKELKEKYRREFWRNPEKYYPVNSLRDLDLVRNKCKKCGKYFWSYDPERDICGDYSCTLEYSFINKKNRKGLSYVKTWELFSKILKKHGYVPIKRYPVSARWRSDINFVEASIDNFIPYVVSGEVEPPAKALTVPQLCLRFNDLENIGITGAHYSLFSMIGQHRFEKAREYNTNEYLLHLYSWFKNGLNLDSKNLVFHEDVWAGSGNFGPCIEVFSGGLELANQVYMQFKQTGTSYKDLKLKVLDMGLGHERNTWFSSNKINSYEAVFPEICAKLRNKIGLEFDMDLLKSFVKYSGYFRVKAKNKETLWNKISEKIGVGVEQLKKLVRTSAAFYSAIDHSRALLVAISDGVLPSNTGAGYNLRALFRRAFGYIETYKWDIDLSNLVEWHAFYLKSLYPELSENLEDVNEILEHERKKYFSTRKVAKKTIGSLKKDLTEKDLIKLYESHGISPEMLVESGLKIKIPSDFYNKVTEKHQAFWKKEEKIKDEILEKIKDVPETVPLFREDDYLMEFEAKVLKIIENYVILDRTAFYPTGGGQEHDLGVINNSEVVNVIKVGKVILHELKRKADFREKELVKGRIDKERRLQLMKHHTATHIISGVCREILGNHIWQAGAEKTPEKARLDITHYKRLSPEVLEKIEERANEIVSLGLKVNKNLVRKAEAEKKYGFRIYQGGAIPENVLRIVSIDNLDFEACGGTHLNNTKEVGRIKIIKSKKIQDGVVRIEFKAGGSVKEYLDLRKREKGKIAKLFEIKDSEKISLKDLAETYSVEPSQVFKTLQNFIKDFKKQGEEIKCLENLIGKKEYLEKYNKIPKGNDGPKLLFREWKNQKKYLEKLKREFENKVTLEILNLGKNFVEKNIDLDDLGTLIRVAKNCVWRNKNFAVVLVGKNFAVGASGVNSNVNILEKLKEMAEIVQGNEKFAKGFKLKE